MCSRARTPMSPPAKPSTLPTWAKALLGIALAAVLVVVVAIVRPGGYAGGVHGEDARADPSEATRTIHVAAIDTAFEPKDLSVRVGDVVTFVVTNSGKAKHEFMLGDAAMQEGHARMMEHGAAPHGSLNMVELEPGESKEITWRFDEPGTILYACHEPGHYDAGMVGEISVA